MLLSVSTLTKPKSILLEPSSLTYKLTFTIRSPEYKYLIEERLETFHPSINYHRSWKPGPSWHYQLHGPREELMKFQEYYERAAGMEPLWMRYGLPTEHLALVLPLAKGHLDWFKQYSLRGRTYLRALSSRQEHRDFQEACALEEYHQNTHLQHLA